MSFGWILAVLFLQRMAELALCHRNRRALIARGGKEFYPETYPLTRGACHWTC
jgi:isoprenylcysteine carboxyl methyltransferase (ICMT) family protein YpbQ